MARTVDLALELNKILQEYGEDVASNMADVIKAATKQGAKAVKSNARSGFGGTGEYAKNWTSQFESGRLSAQGVIYNKELYQLPHLLEHGHAKRSGGRVPGRVHIAPVEEEIERTIMSELRREL